MIRDYGGLSQLNRTIIGLIPAGGQASRIAPLPCSKELYPIGFRSVQGSVGVRPKVASHYLLEKMKKAGISKAYIILREGKWDIPSYWRDGSMVTMDLAYLVLSLPFGVPYTVDRAYAFVCNDIVAFGFPDILFEPDDAFAVLLERQAFRNPDVLLGLFPTDAPEMTDMVDLDPAGRVRDILVKPAATHLRRTWGIAVWTPVFTEFLHQYVAAHKDSAAGRSEVSMGDVIAEAIEAGLRIEAEDVSTMPYLDIGTPANLARGVKLSAADPIG